MAKNINPLTRSLLIKQNWYTVTLPINKHLDNHKETFIRRLISGSFLKLGILTSDISISSNCLNQWTIHMIYYPLINKTTGKATSGDIIIKLIKLIKNILKLKYIELDIKLIFIKAPNKFVEPKILNDYIHYSVMEDPNKIKYVLVNLIREYRSITPVKKKNDTIIN